VTRGHDVREPDAETMAAYVAGTLSPGERRDIEERIARDPELRSEVERLRSVLGEEEGGASRGDRKKRWLRPVDLVLAAILLVSVPLLVMLLRPVRELRVTEEGRVLVARGWSLVEEVGNRRPLLAGDVLRPGDRVAAGKEDDPLLLVLVGDRLKKGDEVASSGAGRVVPDEARLAAASFLASFQDRAPRLERVMRSRARRSLPEGDRDRVPRALLPVGDIRESRPVFTWSESEWEGGLVFAIHENGRVHYRCEVERGTTSLPLPLDTRRLPPGRYDWTIEPEGDPFQSSGRKFTILDEQEQAALDDLTRVVRGWVDDEGGAELLLLCLDRDSSRLASAFERLAKLEDLWPGLELLREERLFVEELAAVR